MLRPQSRHDLEALRERRRLGPIVRLQVADDDVASLGLGLPALLQHAVRLADPGRGTEQYAVAARCDRSRSQQRCG